jgi:hypothetical protein
VGGFEKRVLPVAVSSAELYMQNITLKAPML